MNEHTPSAPLGSSRPERQTCAETQRINITSNKEQGEGLAFQMMQKAITVQKTQVQVKVKQVKGKVELTEFKNFTLKKSLGEQSPTTCN